MARLTFVYDEDFTLRARQAPGDDSLRVTEACYGFVVEEPENLEWALVVQYVGRQDGRTSWMVCMTQCDGVADTRTGLCPHDALPAAVTAAVADLTERWLSQYKLVEEVARG